MRWRSLVVAAASILPLGCLPSRPPVAPAPAAPAVVFPAPDTVWTTGPVVLRSDSSEIPLGRPFTRLDVIGADSLSLRVRCGACRDSVVGWVQRSAVVHRIVRADSAAAASLTEFALAVRDGAARRDLVALSPLMAHDFSFSAVGSYGRDRALSSWISENFRTLDRVPALLDAGLTPLGEWWVAPHGFAATPEYRGLRLGFRRNPEGRWEWVYLVQGEMP